MEHRLPPPDFAELQQLSAAAGQELTPEESQATYAYAVELQRWSSRMSLIQAATWEEVVRRHLAEGWRAADLLPPDAAAPVRLLDVGSGAGIPAIPLLVRRPSVQVVMLEPREKRAAFLRAVLRALQLRASVEALRLQDFDATQPWDVISFRALHVHPDELRGRLAPTGRVIRFPGSPDAEAGAWREAGFELVSSKELPTKPLRVEAWVRSHR